MPDEWREIEPRYGVDLAQDRPPTELARTGNARRWFKIEGGRLFLKVVGA